MANKKQAKAKRPSKKGAATGKGSPQKPGSKNPQYWYASEFDHWLPKVEKKK